MADKNKNTAAENQAKNKNLENTLDFYNEKLTKKAVGRLFQEYIEEGERNYFIPDDEEEKSYQSRRRIPGPETVGSKISSYKNTAEQEASDFNDEEYFNDDFSDIAEDTDEGYYDEQYDQDEYSEYMDGDVDVDYNKEFSYDTVKLYSPRRKRNTRSKSAKKEKAAEMRVSASSSDARNTASRSKKQYKENYIEDYDEYYPEDEYYDSSASASYKIIFIILGIISFALLITTLTFAYKLSVANAELKHLNERINTQNTNGTNDTSDDTAAFVSQPTTEETTTEATTAEAPASQEAEDAVGSDLSSQDTIPSTYTVEKSDSAWKISKKIYGTGEHYLDILEANGLSEADSLTVGQELVIPQF